MKPSILLHVCCAPCSPYVVETLLEEYDITLYFYNPNIHPETEYKKRLEEFSDWAEKINVPFLVGDYNPEGWFEKVAGHEEEPERGSRCELCFDMRLGQCADVAFDGGFDLYGTVLTVSPHKDAVAINRIGQENAIRHGTKFLVANWKKKEGFKITTRIGRELGLYRQDYCGCVFSRREKVAVQ